MICPGCGSSEIRSSRSTSWKDIFQRARGREALRCRDCRLRFFASEFSESVPKQAVEPSRPRRSKPLLNPRAKKRLGRGLIVLAIFAAALLIFLFFLRYLTTERSPSEDSRAVSSRLTSSHS
jgi:hypothetical protein